MTGMKSGAGDDPFADVTDDASEESEERAPETSESEPERDDEVATETEARPTSSVESTAGGATDEATRETQAGSHQLSVEELPYIARRNVRGQSVKTGRDKNVLFELRPEIADRETEFVEELERRLGTSVPKTDAREAALAAIWERPELVVPILEKWGLGYFED